MGNAGFASSIVLVIIWTVSISVSVSIYIYIYIYMHIHIFCISTGRRIFGASRQLGPERGAGHAKAGIVNVLNDPAALEASFRISYLPLTSELQCQHHTVTSANAHHMYTMTTWRGFPAVNTVPSAHNPRTRTRKPSSNPQNCSVAEDPECRDLIKKPCPHNHRIAGSI